MSGALRQHPLVTQITAIADPGQRVFRIAEDLAALDPGLACSFFGSLVKETYQERDLETVITTHAVFLSILLDKWPTEHRRRVREYAASKDDEVTLAFLVSPAFVEKALDDDPPDYGVGRPLTLGERKALARRPSRRLIERALADPHPEVVAKILANPTLTEDDAVRLAARRELKRAALVNLALNEKWRTHRRVCFALASNSGTPPPHSISLLPFLLKNQVSQIGDDHRLSAVVRESAHVLLNS